ncbi:LOW QUALITY PROTEIN: juvenile hormone esterase [Aphomia sociella]
MAHAESAAHETYPYLHASDRMRARSHSEQIQTMSSICFVRGGFRMRHMPYVASTNIRVDPLVLIKQGLVRGRRASDGDYSEFLGIPYANVDLENPFGPSQEPTPFEEEIFYAYNGLAECPQTQVFISRQSGEETLDCLKLNIYVPSKASSNNPLPVLVFIHGGGFGSGSAGEYGAKYLVKHDIVVVTINYRLGPYGFMCLDTPSVPGNQGLKDQYAALRWIRSNIGSWGNPYNVTLSGQSAGACSTLLHLYSSKEKLFHKIIVESGSPQNYGMFVNGDTEAATKLARHLGLNTSNTEEALEFLADTPHNLVTAAAKDLKLQLRPCTEKSFSGVDNFVESDPFSLSNERKIRNTPILFGHTSQEVGTDRDDYFDSDPFLIKVVNSFNMNEDELNKAALNIKHFYVGDATAEDALSKMADFESDFVFNHPMQRTLTNLIAENARPVYEYVFSYTGDSGVEGARHSAELKYLFNMEGEQISGDDQLIIDRITTLWANFIKYGNPTPTTTELIPVTWTPITEDKRPYLVIDTDIRIENRVYNERMAFWDLFYIHYGGYNKLLRECKL